MSAASEPCDKLSALLPLDATAQSALLCDPGTFLDALLSADRVRALDLAMQAVRSGVDVTSVHLHVIQPAMVEVGRLWQQGQLSVAAEHTATAIVQYVVTSLYPLMEKASLQLGNAIVAGVEGEHHQLGAHMVSDALEADGWEVEFLGSDCSLARIVGAVTSVRPRLLALSCTMSENLGEVARVIQAVKAHSPTGAAPMILVGGQGFGRGQRAQRRATELGANALASDLQQAVLTARPWSNLRDNEVHEMDIGNVLCGNRVHDHGRPQ